MPAQENFSMAAVEVVVKHVEVVLQEARVLWTRPTP